MDLKDWELDLNVFIFVKLGTILHKAVELRAGNSSNQNLGSSTLNGRFLVGSIPEIIFLLELWTESIGWGARTLFSNRVPILSKSN